MIAPRFRDASESLLSKRMKIYGIVAHSARLTQARANAIFDGMMPRIQVSIIVVSYNTRDLLLEALSSINENTRGADVELIVVDNASEDGSFDAVRKACPEAVAIRNTMNKGFGAACNQAIRAARSPFVLLLNSDARLTQQAFDALCDCMTSSERCGAAGCTIFNPAGEIVINTRNFLTPLNQAFEQLGITNGLRSRRLRRTHHPALDENMRDCSVDWIDGACLMLRRAAIEEVGLFDEQFFMYSEDEDLCFRLRERGWIVCFTAGGAVFHVGGASAARNHLDMLYHFYLSQRRFLDKHRGASSVLLYTLAMKTTLFLKRLWLQVSPQAERRAEIVQRLAAFKRALSDS